MFANRTTIQTMSPSAAAEGATSGELLLVDVRGADEREEVRAPHSVPIPLGQVEAQIPKLPRDRTIAFICRSGGRSSMAAEVVARRGLDVANVDGGMLAWEAAGLLVESGPETTKE